MINHRPLQIFMLFFAALWFAGWGYAAFAGLQFQQSAREKSFQADTRRDWGTAADYGLHARISGQILALEILAGFALPLGALAVYEAGTVLRACRQGPAAR